MKARPLQLRLGDALRVKSAELWLKLGQPVPALLELQQLPRKAQGHPWANKVFRTAVDRCLGPKLIDGVSKHARRRRPVRATVALARAA
jgi:hypothetical protein